MVEIDPQLSIAKNSVDYYCQLFQKFILEKDCFEFWKIKNDKVEYEGWPDALKMD